MASAARKLIVQQIDVEEINIAPGRRPIDPAAVASLKASIESIGLQTPITLRREEAANDDGELEERWFLVTGHHRLEATRQLGRKYIDAIFMDGDEIDAELWEIAENLHRADLTKEQRDQQIRRFAELLTRKGENQVSQNGTPEIGYKKPPPQKKGVVVQIAQQTGLSKNTVRRALTNKPRTVKIADEPLNEEEACERQVAALMAAWNKASAEAREQFMARIERPVMDQRWSA